MTSNKTLKLLAIASSFGKNTTELLYDAAIAQGYENVTIARLYASGCTLQEHAYNALHPDNKFYQYTRISNIPGDIACGTKWVQFTQSLKDSGTDGTSLEEALAEPWDIILLQQGAAQSPRPDTYENYIDIVLDYLKRKQPNAKFIWNLLWAYDENSTELAFTKYFHTQAEMYQCNVNTVREKVVPCSDFARIIPTGTIIQNARSYYGDTLCKDSFHLNNKGGVLAAFGLLAALKNQPWTEDTMNLDPGYWCEATIRNGISGAGGTIMLTEQDKAVFIESINNALRDPFTVTQTAYTNK